MNVFFIFWLKINAGAMNVEEMIKDAMDTITSADQDLERAKEENCQLQKELNFILFEKQRYMVSKSFES